MNKLDGVKTKLDRADALIDELRKRTEPIARAATESITRERGSTESEVLFRIMHLPPIEPDIAPLVGDILHNLRSSLDHLAWQLVLLDGQTPNHTTQFPILTTPPTSTITIKPLAALSNPAIVDALVEAQPYTKVKYNHDPDDSAFELLRVLNNYDKHRLLLPVVCSIEKDMPAYWGANDGDPQPKYSFTTGPLGLGSVVARFDFQGHAVPWSFRPVFELAVSVMVPEARWLTHSNIANELGALAHNVRWQINYGGFVSLFPDQPRLER